MHNLTLIKQNGGVYIDSREVAAFIGKEHRHLLRDIRGYCGIMEKFIEPNFGLNDFFLESSYKDGIGRTLPCYLLSKMGCEMVANKLIGEMGVLFTAAYVKRYNEMEESEAKEQAKPRLSDFNNAVKNVLDGMAYCLAAPKRVLDFLRGVYEPLGISVPQKCDGEAFYTVTEIAKQLGVYSVNGRPHGRAVSAIISKLEDGVALHAVAVPYGLVGVSMRYDSHIVEAVRKWVKKNNFPANVPHSGYEYHTRYKSLSSFFDESDWED